MMQYKSESTKPKTRTPDPFADLGLKQSSGKATCDGQDSGPLRPWRPGGRAGAAGTQFPSTGDELDLVRDGQPTSAMVVIHDNKTRIATLFTVYDFPDKQPGTRWLWP